MRRQEAPTPDMRVLFVFMSVKIIKDEKGNDRYVLVKDVVKKKTGYFVIYKKRWFDEWKILNPTQRSIMVSLWLYGAGTGVSWNAMRSLSGQLGVCTDTIFLNIRKLEKLGFVKITKEKGRGRYFNVYQLLK